MLCNTIFFELYSLFFVFVLYYTRAVLDYCVYYIMKIVFLDKILIYFISCLNIFCV